MTVTQKELVQMVEKNWLEVQMLKQDDRKVLVWSDGEEEILKTDRGIQKSSMSPTDPSKSFNNDSSAFYDEID
jgi:hypothetical protein